MRIILLAFVMLMVADCTPDGGVRVQPDAQGGGRITSALKEENTQQLTDLTNVYLKLKEAMVAGNAGEIRKHAEALGNDAEALRDAMSSDSTMKAGFASAQFDSIINYAGKIALVNDNRGAHQRILFAPLSQAMYSLLQTAQIENVQLYRQYCPTALHDSGAWWLSADEYIRNPYYGNAMLECGEITDTL